MHKKGRDFRVPEKKGEITKTKQSKKWAGDKPPDAQIAHNPVFRSFIKIHRNIPVSTGSFIAIREGDPPRLPQIHKVPQVKVHTARKLPAMSTLWPSPSHFAFQIAHTSALSQRRRLKSVRRIVRRVGVARRLITYVVLAPITGRLAQLSPRLHQWPPELITRLFDIPSQPLIIGG